MRKLIALIFLLPAVAGASGIYNPGSSGGGGGTSVYPATATASFPFGASFSTATATTEATTSSGLTTLGQVNNLSFPNLATNGDYETWRYTTNLSFLVCNVSGTAADLWTGIFNCSLGNANFERVTSPVKFGNYSMELLGSGSFTGGTAFYVRQAVPNYYDYYSSSVTLSVWVQITSNGSSSNYSAAIDDGVTASTSATISTADSTWHQLTVTHFMSASSTQLLIKIGQLTSATNSVAYIDGASLVRGDVATDLAPRNFNVEMGAIQTYPTGTGGIVGSPTNDSAPAGNVGEYISSYTVAAVGTTNQFTNIAQISLTAGDWDVTGGAQQNNGAATIGVNNNYSIALSQFSGNTTTDHLAGDNQFTIQQPGSNEALSIVVPPWRVSLSTAATVYLKGSSNFSAGTLTYTGRMSARRVR